jgi:RND family efflux transporter MFP subunit
VKDFIARLLCLLLLAGCGTPTSEVAKSATVVSVTTAVSAASRASVTVRGTVAFKDEMRLSFKVGGVVRRIAVEVGTAVKPGQLLADIEPTEVDAQLAQSQQLDARAARDLARGENLRADEVISVEQLQNLRTQHELAAAQLRAARFNQERARIVAPAGGVLLRRHVEEHELVQAGQPIVTLGSATRGHLVRAVVSDRDLLQLRRGDQVAVTLDAAPGTVLTGHISTLSMAADSASGLFPIEIELAPTDLALVSGMVARIVVAPPATTPAVPGEAGDAEKRVRVPASAIVAADGPHASVFVVTEGKAHQRAVTVAYLDGDSVALSAGVNAGENVVSAGAPYLDDGEVVRVAAAPKP